MHDLKKLSKTLNRRGFETEIAESGRSALNRIFEIIGNSTIGLGSSMTLANIGLLEKLKKHSNKVFFHIPGEHGENERNALLTDYFLTSANAVSMDGNIVNIDGTGNRVAATCFGPKNVIYLVGKNKITENLDEALLRAKKTAVKLAKHFNRKTPCAVTGKCEDCLSPECLCSITTIHRKKPYGLNIHIILIDEELGI